MSPSPQLAPPGSSSYDSNTLHVGDGTWDASRDDFLLPNLVGLNFATMRYNGMGNRFFTMTGYHSLVEAHGIIAAITFLGAIPASILLMRFYGRRPRLALRLHIWLQILSLLLTTVLFILGWMAVGPRRSLSNPHHGIGLALYVLVWVSNIGGCLVHRREKNKRRLHIPLSAMLHNWLGRVIALLGIVQVALGLTLYGSPLYLFILYAFYVFGLTLLYFILQWLYERRRSDYNNQGSYYSEEEVVPGRNERKHGRFTKLLAAGTVGAGIAALLKRRSDRDRRQDDVVGTDDSGTSYMTDEKYSETSHQGWGHRLLQVGAIGGAVYGVKRFFDRRERRDDVSDVGPYRPPLGGNQSVANDSMSRVEEAHPPMRPITPTGNSPGYVRPSHPLAQPPMTPGLGGVHSTSSYSYGSYISGSPSHQDRRHHTFRDALAAGGAVFAVRQLFKNRRQNREERREEDLRDQRMEEERIARMNSAHRYTGDGVTPPRRVRHNLSGSQSASDTSSVLEEGRRRPGMGAAIPAAGVGAAAASAMAGRNRIRPVGTDPLVANADPHSGLNPATVPPIPPTHRNDLDSSGSELYTTTSGRPRHRHHLRDEAGAGLAGVAAGALAADHAHRRHSGRNTDSMESPPVSLKVKMHGDGRHVTLRRLTEEEAAAQREARRQERRASGSRRRRNSSFSSSSGGEALGRSSSADRRWRRTEALEARQAAENQAAAAAGPSNFPPPPPFPPGSTIPHPNAASSHAINPQTGHEYQLPPPPPIPGSTSNLGPPGSITSPGTETSGATEYANNRRRRRAERAQARLAREGRAQNTVDFT